MFQSSPDPHQTPDPSQPQASLTWLPFIAEIIKVIAPVTKLIISIINLKYALWMFRAKNTREDEDKDRNRKEGTILDQQIKLRRSFIDTLIAVDAPLYDFVLEKVDNLVANINVSIFDPGVNLNHKPMFEEKVLKLVSEYENRHSKKNV